MPTSFGTSWTDPLLLLQRQAQTAKTTKVTPGIGKTMCPQVSLLKRWKPPPLVPQSTVTGPAIRSSAVPDIKRTNFFALIIGIDKYADPGCSLLHGAVADATAVRDYVMTELRVPSTNILFLKNKYADRASIIKGFQKLRHDHRIKKNDPILIYYAGHGSETTAPPGWPSGNVENKIQMIIPQDFSKSKRIHGIPDRTIAALLNGISAKKGDNITIIFDCCSSSSGTRSNDPLRRVRSAKIDDSIPLDIDKELLTDQLQSRTMSIAPGFHRTGLRSHVLMAACGAKEEAREQNGRGVFTQALLRVLAEFGPEKLTYASVIENMPKLPDQNPQCEGENRHRMLFDAKAPGPRRVSFAVKMKERGYTLAAGSVHGITEGAEFTVYKNRESIPRSTPLGILVASRPTDISPFHTVLQPKAGSHIELTPSSFALQTKAGEAENLPFRIPLDERLMPLYKKLAKEMQKTGPDRRGIRPVQNNAEAKMGVSLVAGSVVFDILDTRVTDYGLRRMPHTVALADAQSVFRVIRSAAHFHWYLGREQRDRLIQRHISVHFSEVTPTEGLYDDERNPVYDVATNNLYKSGVIDIVADEDTFYGLKVTNNSDRDLYLNAFYFDNSDLSITSYYQTPTSGNNTADPTFRSNGGSISIGYGSGGDVPRQYTLEDDADIDVGFLMLFITSENVDLSMVPQNSPFEPDGRKPKKYVPRSRPVWGTMLIPIITRRTAVTST